jgi:H+-translocating NAD(P) transhydrogenase subunit alpha
MKLGVPRETFPGESRVALVPSVLAQLAPTKLEVLVESGAGTAAGFSDAQFAEKGAKIVDRPTVFRDSEILLQVRAAGMNPDEGRSDLPLYKKGQLVVAMADPLSTPQGLLPLAETGATLFAMELMPRITRAQSMDVLSSMATIAGYKAVLIAAMRLPKIFPMLMTAAGTISAARAFIVGAGVAGLQAIATSKRLGAVVEAYDVRPAVKEQVQSLGAKFVDLGLETKDAQDAGGYAKAQDEAFLRRQREVMTKVVAGSDFIITTAAVPGKKSPILVTADMVRHMAPGSVVVDLAAERGGNCELTRAGEEVVENGVIILGPLNLAASVPKDASNMYSRNLVTFVRLLFDKDAKFKLNLEDECIRETMVVKDGEIALPRIKELISPKPAAAEGARAQQ